MVVSVNKTSPFFFFFFLNMLRSLLHFYWKPACLNSNTVLVHTSKFQYSGTHVIRVCVEGVPLLEFTLCTSTLLEFRHADFE